MTVNQSEKAEKYITDIKELPPAEEAPLVANKTAEKRSMNIKTPEKVIPAGKKAGETKVKEPDVKKTADNKMNAEEKDVDRPRSFLTLKDIILGIINLITIIFLIFLLTMFPQKSVELKNEKIKEIQSQINPILQYGTLDGELQKAVKLESLFADESGVVDFVGAVEKLKGEKSSIQKVTFASQAAVKDKMGIFGIPVIIELKGNWQSIGPDLEKIQTLPFLFRPVNISAAPSKDDPGVIIFSYGGLLYVNDKLGQTK